MTHRPIRVVAFAGSLRRGSLNRRLLEAAIALAPEGMAIERLPLGRVPFYDGDVEAAGDPASVRRLKQAIRDADALLIATPEYNHSLPAVTKNAIDWASRPPSEPPLADKPVALMGASPGRGGARRALEHARIALEAAGARVIDEQVSVARAPAVFDAEGALTDEPTGRQLEALLAALRMAVGGRIVRRVA